MRRRRNKKRKSDIMEDIGIMVASILFIGVFLLMNIAGSIL